MAVQTIYSSVGTKSALVLALGDLIEEEADAPRLNAEIAQQTDPRQLIATGVHLTRQLNERCGDILEILFTATSAEPDAAALAAEGCAGTTTAPTKAPGGSRRSTPWQTA